jgi:glycosyltransferase involved in cell wall biosynthesis
MALNTGILERLRSDRKSAGELGVWPMLAFRAGRLSRRHRAAFTKPEPLVSICIATYNRAELLLERAVASSLAQTYRNIEVIVVGDGCTDRTADLMRAVDDPRLRFVNREGRGDYPVDPELRWMVAGADAMNHAFTMARGDFITQLDDDDTHSPNRAETLVAFMKRSGADLAFHPFEYEDPDRSWHVNGARRFQLGSVTTSSIFYHRSLLRIPVDKASALRFREPADWNRLRKFRYLGAAIRRHPAPMLRHFRERSQYGR